MLGWTGFAAPAPSPVSTVTLEERLFELSEAYDLNEHKTVDIVLSYSAIVVRDGGEIKYFLLQGAAIMVEDLLMWVLGAGGSRPLWDSPTSFTIMRLAGFICTATFYTYTRVKLKCVPLTVVHGIHDDRGDLFAALELVRRGAAAVPGNFVRSALEAWPFEGISR